jgi:hypothetical protein
LRGDKYNYSLLLKLNIMEVQDSISFENFTGYSIEWGNATWTQDEQDEDKDRSIRNRYSKADGGFNQAGSSEVPWEDFRRMITESIRRGHFNRAELTDMLTNIQDSLNITP